MVNGEYLYSAFLALATTQHRRRSPIHTYIDTLWDVGSQSQFEGADGSTVRDVLVFCFHLNDQDKFALQQMAYLSTIILLSMQPCHLQQIYDVRIVSSILSHLIYSKCDQIHPPPVGLSPEIKATKTKRQRVDQHPCSTNGGNQSEVRIG